MNKKLAITGICFDLKSSFMRGPVLAPPAIRQALHDGSSNSFSESGIDPFIATTDTGDFHFEDVMDIEKLISRQIKEYDRILCWGGDHSITYPIIKALSSERGADFDILHFDAHGDLYDSFEGDPLSHACPFARIMESGLCRSLYQVGIRTLTPHQRDQLKRWDITCIEMKNLERWREIRFTRPVYISIDLDGFDPAYAPGVSHMEAGGLSPREVINYLMQIQVPVIGADIVEYNPLRDVSQMTAYLAAKLTKEVLSKMI